MGMPNTAVTFARATTTSPWPRMTNTYMLNGDDIARRHYQIRSSAASTPSTSARIGRLTNGKFVFSASEAYLI